MNSKKKDEVKKINENNKSSENIPMTPLIINPPKKSSLEEVRRQLGWFLK